jgi:hypothetical protein
MGEAVRVANAPQGAPHWINPRTGKRTPAHMMQDAGWLQTTTPEHEVGIE